MTEEYTHTISFNGTSDQEMRDLVDLIISARLPSLNGVLHAAQREINHRIKIYEGRAKSAKFDLDKYEHKVKILKDDIQEEPEPEKVKVNLKVDSITAWPLIDSISKLDKTKEYLTNTNLTIKWVENKKGGYDQSGWQYWSEKYLVWVKFTGDESVLNNAYGPFKQKEAIKIG